MIDLTCYKCGGQVCIAASQGGRSTGELTLYRAACFGKGQYERDGCGMVEDDLSTDGTLRGAKAHYHRVAVAQAMAAKKP